MKNDPKIGLFALVLGLTPAWAIAGEKTELNALAEVSGLTHRQICMLLHARTPYAESRYAYERIRTKFVKAIGEDQYRDMLAGKPVRFERAIDGRAVAIVVKLEPRG
jgi:hypothetical protein